MDSVQTFYDDLAESYHLIFEDWNRSIDRQADALTKVLAERWGLRGGRLLDVAAGIGTQALGLAARGFEVVAADLSPRAVARAQREASRRGLSLPVVAADFRWLPFATETASAVIACDNALPHLPSLDEIRRALKEFNRCVRPGGGIVLSVRDYGEPPPAGTVERRPYGERDWNGRRVFAEQEWHWHGATYEVRLQIRPLDGDTAAVVAVRTTYLAVPVSAILELMRDIGLAGVERLDGAFYQPLLIGTVPNAA
jgi:glycine/sarcosine N-methyltransferase